MTSRLSNLPPDAARLQPTFAYAKLPAQDIDRAKRFYADMFDVRPFAEHDGHVYYDVSGCRFILFASAGTPSGTHDQLGFVTHDLESHVAQARARGVVFEDFPFTTNGIADFGPVRAAWFHDSEGNLVNLIEGESPLWSQC